MAWKEAVVIEVYRDRKGEYRWRAKHRNGNILADSAEGYKTRAGAMRSWIQLAKYFADGNYRLWGNE